MSREITAQEQHERRAPAWPDRRGPQTVGWPLRCVTTERELFFGYRNAGRRSGDRGIERQDEESA